LREPLRDLRGMRNFDPRRAVVRTLFEDDSAASVKPNGYAPGPGPASIPPAAIPPAAAPPALPPARPLTPGERPPIDPDATSRRPAGAPGQPRRGGRRRCQSVACWNACAAARTAASACRGPTIWSPIGRPSEVKPQGTLAAGCCVMLNG